MKTPQSEANRRALEARRERLAEELRQMVADAERWNRTHPDEEPIIVDVNLTPDVARLLAAPAGIVLDPVQPVGTRKATGFVDRTDGTGGVESWDELVYPPHPEGESFRGLRRSLEISIGEAARRLGIKPSEVSGLEFGRVVPRAGWEQLRARLEEKEPTR